MRIGTPQIAAMLLAALPATAEAQSDEPDQPVVPGQVQQLMLAARDGTRLETFVFLPEGDGPFPTLITQTIYGLPISPIGGHGLQTLVPTSADLAGDAEDDDEDDATDAEAIAQGWPAITSAGYALVIQNTRGRFGSEGLDRSWRDDGTDGYDLVEWVNAQGWSNGRIGVFGDSATGLSALMTAAEQPPSLDAVFVQNAPGDIFGTDLFPRDGSPKIETLLVQGASIAFDTSDSHRALMGLSDGTAGSLLEAASGYLEALLRGLEDPTASEAWMALPLADDAPFGRLMPFWDTLTDAAELEDYRQDVNLLGEIGVPTSVVTMWQDVFHESAMDLFLDLQERGIPRELLVLNGSHYEIDNPGNWPEPRMIGWFDSWLKDAAPDPGPIINYAVQGQDAYRSADLWPPVDAEEVTLFLAPAAGLTQTPQRGAAEFTYDPASPATTLGGRNLVAAAGSTDHAGFLMRDDVVTFRSEVFADGLALAGPITATLAVTTDVVSTDISLRLLDLAPSGAAMLISQDLVRFDAVPGRERDVAFDLGDIAHRLAPGHRLAVSVNGSDFPAADRNLNTGQSGFESDRMVTATTSISLGGDTVSSVTMSVLP